MTDYNTVPEAVEALKAGKVDPRHRRPRPRERGRLHLRRAVRHDRERQLHGKPREGPHLHAHERGVRAQAAAAADGGAQHRQPRDRLHRVHRPREHDDGYLGRGARLHGAHDRATTTPRRSTSAVPATCSRCSPRKTACSSATATPRPPSTCCRLADLKQVRPVLRGHARRRHDDAHVRAARRGKALRPDGHHNQGAADATASTTTTS